MFKFFRSLRKHLLSENKFSKYLLYAIGEIVLVVIGILIALKINTMNENRRLAEEEQVYLSRMNYELAKDSIYFTRRLTDSQQEIANYTTFIRKAYQTQNTLEEFIDLMRLNGYNSEHLSVENATYYEMLNAGKFDLVSSDTLKYQIFDLYRNYDKVEKHVKEFNEFSIVRLHNFGQTIYGGSKYWPPASAAFNRPEMIDPSNWAFINQPNSDGFKMVVETASVYLNKHSTFIGYFELLLNEISTLRNEIRQHLEAKKK